LNGTGNLLNLRK